MPKKEYYQGNKEKYRKESNAYYSKNRELVNQKRRHPRRKHTKEELRAVADKYKRKWFKENMKRLSPLAWGNHLKRKYGITSKEYNFLLESQNGCCAICQRETSKLRKRLNVDHCHKTNTIRGLLCWDCNIGISKFRDEPRSLERAALYVQSHSNHNIS